MTYISPAERQRAATAAFRLRGGAAYNLLERERRRAKGLREKYGLTPEQVEQMFDAAEDKCQCCSRPVARQNTGANKSDVGHIDHCHTTHKVRGILCNTCNQALGLLKDNPHMAVAYLERTAA